MQDVDVVVKKTNKIVNCFWFSRGYRTTHKILCWVLVCPWQTYKRDCCLTF